MGVYYLNQFLEGAHVRGCFEAKFLASGHKSRRDTRQLSMFLICCADEMLQSIV